MSRHPEVKWAEREDKVYLTVLLPDAKNPKVNVDPDGTFTFSAAAGSDNNLYEVKLNLLDKVNVEESKINIGVRNIFCVLEKAEKKWWTKLLHGDEKTPHYLKVDWDKWVDEDDDTGAPSDLDLDGMDFSKFGDMGGMGGMGDMSGLGGMGGFGDSDAMGDDFEDSDDDEEIKKPEVKEAADKAEGEAPKDKAETAPAS
ncbi:HSP20-like chaperones superfamily protein [Striga asiatica]|uniref:Co-chaperone protein p23 n=1 Tax=Striga asiatica TaxID=4170 RepID=A0A5A7PJE1_STRAF|nr:HSP20-like chaperones superfamily protein [Striga asiatica]